MKCCRFHRSGGSTPGGRALFLPAYRRLMSISCLLWPGAAPLLIIKLRLPTSTRMSEKLFIFFTILLLSALAAISHAYRGDKYLQ